jgi:D-alanyl-D-alanine carboxypeptidase
MMYPVHKIIMPLRLREVPNGELPARLLANLKPYGQLFRPAARAYLDLVEAGARDGFTFSHVGAYRSLTQQVSLFKTRYSRKPTGRVPQVTRVWNGDVWYLKKGMAPAASPGKSNHGYGLAIDICEIVNKKPVSLGPDARKWLLANAERYGWCWEVADPYNPNFELWHLVCWNAGNLPEAEPATRVKRLNRQQKRGIG